MFSKRVIKKEFQALNEEERTAIESKFKEIFKEE
jgi:hypothetical protein